METNNMTPGQSALCQASRAGDAQKVRHLLKVGYSPSSPNDGTDSSRSSSTELVDPNCINEYGSTPLILASIKGHTPVVALLLEGGANIDFLGPDRWTALHGACFFGHVDTTAYLLKSGAQCQLNSLERLPGWDFDSGVPVEAAQRIQELVFKRPVTPSGPLQVRGNSKGDIDKGRRKSNSYSKDNGESTDRMRIVDDSVIDARNGGSCQTFINNVFNCGGMFGGNK
uniref:Uncharacterized protein n=1 Tax=Fibrocapsa japonica TaxID=94617 RepID=A0A7S2UTX1_9STRA|mmetsp:Transcript_13179/g.19442  ORF Transcript_13179/g.19442 Transcript_13179/m.19442 type:complete len:227 (+) Transcript_13179:69-749(+)